MLKRSALLCLLVLAGCPGSPEVDGGAGGGGGSATGGGGGATGGGGGATALTVTAFCQQRTGALCAAGVTCGWVDTQAGCVALFEQQRLDYSSFDECAVGLAAVADGRAAFDATAAADCLATAATTCQVVSIATGVCRNVFRPLVPQGGSCFDDRECATGTFCQEAMTCPGTCQARVPVGQSVGNGERCVEGLYTSLEPSTDGGFGYAIVCRAVVPAGQPCANVTACVAGLACRGDTGTCGTPRADGQACVVTDGGIFGPTLVQDCERLHACQPTDAGFACAPLGGLGAVCGTCKADLRCLAGRCATRGVAGEACTTVNDCASGFYCRSSGPSPLGPGFCQAREPVGATCAGDLDCARGLGCVTVPASDGGFIPEHRCAAVDGGTLVGCVDRTP